MLDFLQRALGIESSKSSKKVAKERLRLVLLHDRASMSPQILESLREDLIRSISKYLEIDEKGLQVNLSRERDSVALVANIPILRVKRVITR